MGLMRRFSSLSSNTIKNRNTNSFDSNDNIITNCKNNEEKEICSNSSNASTSKISDKVDKQTFDIVANLDAYKQRCKALEAENRRLMSNLNVMIEKNNKNNEPLLEEINQLKEQMNLKNNEKQELLNLIQRLSADCEKERELTREWQRVGQFNNKVIQRDIQRYQTRIELLEQKCTKMTSESVELKKLCLYLSRQRQALLNQLGHIYKTENSGEEINEENEVFDCKDVNLVENSLNTSQIQIDGIQETVLQSIYSDMQSSYLLAQLEATPRRKGLQQLSKEFNNQVLPCFCNFSNSGASTDSTTTTNFGSSFYSLSSDDTSSTTIFVLDKDGEEEFQKIEDSTDPLLNLPQLQVRELCTISEEKESDNEENFYLKNQSNWREERTEEKLENFKNLNTHRNSSTSTSSSSSSSGAFSATSSNGEEFRGENDEKKGEEENDYLPPEMPLLLKNESPSIITQLNGRPSSCMETNILENYNLEQRATLPRVNNNINSNNTRMNGRLSLALDVKWFLCQVNNKSNY
ncbi:hypothetical protein Mgra_00005201 [Meloidogyne graminicola]|uniref:Uncharacterized protein n=1 Tax=Meloidogyne graminicola TaxID=189291 RepID=A0A8S9ZPN0_9BILA|nr:hypothetical protein Mgra_00005201 [Meloidogyne graminicola]